MKLHRLAGYVTGFVFCSFTWWLAGFNFNERSADTALWFFMANSSGWLGLLVSIAMKEMKS